MVWQRMADNAWTDLIVYQDPKALAPSGDYFYHLACEPSKP